MTCFYCSSSNVKPSAGSKYIFVCRDCDERTHTCKNCCIDITERVSAFLVSPQRNSMARPSTCGQKCGTQAYNVSHQNDCKMKQSVQSDMFGFNATLRNRNR